MNIQDFGAISRAFGLSETIRSSRWVRVAAGIEDRFAEADRSLHSDVAFKSADQQAPPRQVTHPPTPANAALAVAIVFAILIASVFVGGFVSTALLVGAFGIPYAAFVLVYPAVVTFSSFLRTIPTFVGVARAKEGRAALMVGAFIGALLVLPATYFLAKWGVQAFGYLLPHDAKEASYVALNLSMAVDLRSVPDWMKEMTPYVSFVAAIAGLFATARAKNKAGRSS